MPFNMRPTFGRQATTDASSTNHAEPQVVTESLEFNDKNTPAVTETAGSSSSSWNDGVDQDAQLGVKKAQATTLTWSKTALYTTLSWYVDSGAIFMSSE